MSEQIPVITIDGPSGTGKGTIAALLSKRLGFYLLDSGALYRTLAWAVLRDQVNIADEVGLEACLSRLDIVFEAELPSDLPKILCDGNDITHAIRQESVGNMASKIAAIPLVREHLLKYQRMMRKPPGLIADGRDMGSVIFPDASLKFYLDASAEVRAERRFTQLKEKGINVSLRDIIDDLAERDYRDEHRTISPMVAMPDMIRIDTSKLDIESVLNLVLEELPAQLQV